MLRRKQGAEVTRIINRVNIKARRVSHKKNFRRVRTLFLPAGRGARYNRMRKRSWLNFIRRFFRINAYFRFSLCPNFYLRGLRKKRNSNRYIDATQASRLLNSFIISRNVTLYTLA